MQPTTKSTLGLASCLLLALFVVNGARSQITDPTAATGRPRIGLVLGIVDNGSWELQVSVELPVSQGSIVDELY